jgi:hypothetical protein
LKKLLRTALADSGRRASYQNNDGAFGHTVSVGVPRSTCYYQSLYSAFALYYPLPVGGVDEITSRPIKRHDDAHRAAS